MCFCHLPLGSQIGRFQVEKRRWSWASTKINMDSRNLRNSSDLELEWYLDWFAKRWKKYLKMSCEPRQKIMRFWRPNSDLELLWYLDRPEKRWKNTRECHVSLDRKYADLGCFLDIFLIFWKTSDLELQGYLLCFEKTTKNVLKMSCEPRQEILWSLIANSDLELLWYLNRPVFKRKNAWKCPVSLELRTIEKTISDQENAFTGGPFWSTAAQNLPEWPDPNFCVPRKGGTMEEQLRNHRSAQKCSRSDVFWSGCEYRTLAPRTPLDDLAVL